MTTEIVTALIALLGTALGTFGGIITSAKLTTYRIEQLEKKVDKHNNFAERIPVLEKDIKNIYHEIDEMKEDERNV